MKKIAFTLAEVLITLVIIGIIAALTIPNLMQKYTEQTTVKKVQKFYSNLTNAYALAIKENGNPKEWGITGKWNAESEEKIYSIIFKPYFKVAKNCGINNTNNCIIKNKYYKTLFGDYLTNNFSAFYKIALEDGTAVIIYNSNYDVYFLFDTNGIKGPNQVGVDLFYFWTSNEKITPFGIPNFYGFNTYCQKSSSLAASGLGCAAWVIYKGNMDYLHCDLTWDKHSCKDK